MSVIVFKQGELAGDSLLSSHVDGAVLGHKPKVFCVDTYSFGPGLLGLCGNIYLMEGIALWVINEDFKKHTSSLYSTPEYNREGANAFFISKEEAAKSNNGKACTALLFDWFASGPVTIHLEAINPKSDKMGRSIFSIGSGGQIALGAAIAGCTAKDAVKIAVQRNTKCGEPIYQVSHKSTPKKFYPGPYSYASIRIGTDISKATQNSEEDDFEF